MSDHRTPEELAGGFLRVRVGGQTKNLPTLKIRAERDWKMTLGSSVAERSLELDLNALRAGGDTAASALRGVLDLPSDMALDLVLAYDRSGALGGREWLEENADSDEIYRVLMRIMKVVFPFASGLFDVMKDVGGLQRLMAIATGAPSPVLNSTNGHSPTGLDESPKETSTPSS